MKPTRSHGRQSARPSLKPRALMQDAPDYADVWQARLVTLFPDLFPGVLGASLTGKALHEGRWQLHTHDLRDFGIGKHRNVDDTPAGGGAGMVMRADVVGPALARAQSHAHGRWPILYMSPRGRRFDQAMARDLASCAGVTLLCGRFEGVDEREIEHIGITEVSLGDFGLAGTSAIYPPRRRGRARDSARSNVGQPWRDREMAAGAGRRADPQAPP